MLHNKTIAIFIHYNDKVCLNTIKHIYNFFKDNYEDLVIISDINDTIPKEYAVIPSIYLKFFQGDIVFLSAQTYLETYGILANNIYVVTSVEEILNNNISKNRLKDINILNIDDQKIEVIKNAQI